MRYLPCTAAIADLHLFSWD